MFTSKSRLIQAAVLIISLLVIVNASRTIIELWRRQDMITDRKNQVEVLRQENAALEAKLREAQSEQYTERVARDKLGLVREGERVVIVPKSEIINPNDQLPTAELPRWRQWWGLFF